MTPQWPEVEMDDYQFAFDEILQGVAAMALNNKTQSTGTVCSSSLSWAVSSVRNFVRDWQMEEV